MHNLPISARGHLITGSQDDPLLPQLIQAIEQATCIEVAVSFIQPSGLKLLFEPLSDALKRNASIALLTSDYLSITHPEALRMLLLLAERGACIRVFECKNQISFHLKSYIFTQIQQGTTVFGQAFIGSNNISQTALLAAHEWAWRQEWHPSPWASTEFQRIRQAFNQLLQHPACQPLTNQWLERYQHHYQQQLRTPATATATATACDALTADNVHVFPVEQTEKASPSPIQAEALMALAETRQQGFKRGLVVLATGLGKTWLAGFDVAQAQAKRVLFIAHREEILLQAQRTFTHILPQHQQGLLQAGQNNTDAPLLFASIQSLSRKQHLTAFSPHAFDYVIVDEFHHASSPSYLRVLEYFQPKFLLGLTATPERTDQADILSLCDNNLVFERHLATGIQQRLLAPYHYYGIYDELTNYQEIPWRNGQFDPAALETAFATRQRAGHAFKHWQQLKQRRTLAFCISKKHADFMADYFIAKGIKAAAVYADSTWGRHTALHALTNGELEIIFSVDLFNEGTDLPALDTLLMLRPTSSKILFLQQLGRGLRLSAETQKTHVVVIDLLGNHQQFFKRPGELLAASQHASPQAKQTALQSEIRLANGCYLNFDPQWLNLCHEFSQQSARQTFHALNSYLQLYQQLNRHPTATEFYHAGFSLAKMRKQQGSWFELRLIACQQLKQTVEQLELQTIVQRYGEFLLKAIESTAMTKSFKAYLIQAFVQLGGLEHPVLISELAQRCWFLLKRRPDVWTKEIPLAEQSLSATDAKWLSYWKRNPINYSCTKNANSPQAWFKQDGHYFSLTITIAPQDVPLVRECIYELLDLRFAQYFASPATGELIAAPQTNLKAAEPRLPY